MGVRSRKRWMKLHNPLYNCCCLFVSKDLDGWCHLQISEKHKPAEWKKHEKNKQSLLVFAFLPSAEAHPTIGTVDCLACSFCSFLGNKNTYTSYPRTLVYTKGGRTSLPYCRTFPTTHLNYSIQTMELLAIATLVGINNSWCK